MNRVDHIFGAFSPAQIKFLTELVRKRRDDMNNLKAMTDDEQYCLELLEKAETQLSKK